MRILVLGGTRFIGAAAVRTLARAGHEVCCFHRGRHPGELPEAVLHVHGERRDLAEHTQTLRAFRPERILDQRALEPSDADAVLTLARALEVPRIVMISSMDVYKAFGVVLGRETWAKAGAHGPAPAARDSNVSASMGEAFAPKNDSETWAGGGVRLEPQDEEAALREVPYPHRADPPLPADDPLAWTNTYDKIPTERAFLDAGDVEATVLRLPMVYGPGDYQRRVRTYLRPMLDGRARIPLAAGLARWETTRGYVDDIGLGIAAALCAEEGVAGEVFNLGEEVFRSELSFAEEIARAAGWTGEFVLVDEPLPEVLAPGIETAQPLRVTSRKARERLGYGEALSFAERIERSVAWERAHPPEGEEPADYAPIDAALEGR